MMHTNQKTVLGVDRLDYTKGLVHRLKAFEKLLEKHPEHIEKVSKFIGNLVLSFMYINASYCF